MSEHIFADNVRELSASIGTGDFITTGGSVVIPTSAIGRTIDSVVTAADTFDYVIHHADLDEWEVGVGTYNGSNTFSRTRVISSSNGNALVNFTAGQKAVWIGPTSEVRHYFADITNVISFGATAGGSNTVQLASARAHSGVNKPVFAPSNSGSPYGVKQGTVGDFGGDTLGEGSLFSASQGTSALPSTKSSPLIYLEKYTQGSGSNINDHGCIDARMNRIAGNNYSYTGYFSAQNSGGTAGRVSPLAALLKCSNTLAIDDVAAIFYSEKAVSIPAGTVTGLHLDMLDTSGDDVGWKDGYAFGSTYGMNIQVAAGRGTMGIRLSSSGVSGTGVYTGILVDENSILPSSLSGTAEAIRIKGGSDGASRYTGLWCQSGYMDQAINLVGPSYGSSVMMLLPKDNYISFGTTAATAAKLKWTSGDIFSIYGGTYGVAGTQVLGARITGWSASSGTPTRSGFSTSSASTSDVAEALKALIDDLFTHGVIGT